MRHNTPRTEARQPGRRRKQRYPEGGTRSTAGGHWLELAIVLCCIASALLALSVIRLTSSAISNNEVGTFTFFGVWGGQKEGEI